MLPVFTTVQVKDGIDTGDYMLDLSEYMKKKDAATKTEIESLTAILANKLDATPQHKHDIANIKDLREELDSKYDTSKRYSYNVILSDSEKIPYLEAPRVGKLDISCNSGRDGYVFYVDEANGDLMITLNDVLIGSYSIAAGKWSFETDTSEMETKINSVEDIINQYVAKTDAVLKNHYDAILLLCQKHGMVDGDGDGASNITPKDD
jgi:carboxypeptidase C (cathepsin A)